MARPAFTIRAAREAELPQLPAIEKAAEQLFPPERLTPSTTQVALQTLHHAWKEDCLRVAEADGAVVGFCVAELCDRDFHILEIDVLPAFGNRGIGRALLQAMIACGRKQKCKRITLTTFADFPWNGPFYQSMGFVEVPASKAEPRLSAQLAKEQLMGYTGRVAMALPLTETKR